MPARISHGPSASHSSPVGFQQLSIFVLLAFTAGVGLAISVSRWIALLRLPADRFFYGENYVPALSVFDAVVAGVYGVCVTAFILAVRSGNFWQSPGKTIALLFAMMCVLDWGLGTVAAVITRFQILEENLNSGTPGFLFNIWYRDFSATLGYIAGIPVLLFVLLMTRKQPITWRLVWIGFLFFSLLIIGRNHFDFQLLLSPQWRNWYFDGAIGVPILLMLFALIFNALRRRPQDWWTIGLASVVISTWIFLVTGKLLSGS